MRQIVFSVYDIKAECYLFPFTYPAIGQAIRQFQDMCSDDNHPMGKHRSDYRLYRIGEFDDNTGDIVAAIPTVLCTGEEVVGTRLRTV
ncbi:MAG: nonstructural protein [Microvirus sp.]|nr:MAG: nonstructural protein [Microvirus sp.]